MRSRYFAVAAVVAVLIVAAVTLGLSDHEKARVPYQIVNGETAEVTYHTEGNEWTGEYVVGAYNSLPIPESDGLLFTGWYLDEDLTRPVGAILPDMAGSIDLYASWSDSIIGSGFTVYLSGKYYNGNLEHGMSGTMTYRMMAEISGKVYVQFENDIQYMFPSGGGSHDQRVGGYWSDGAWSGRYVGSGEVDGRMCQIWDDGDTVTWVADRYYILRTESSSRPNDITGTMTDTFGFTPDVIFDIRVVADVPLRIAGAEDNTIGSPAVLVASGEDFSGWYVDGKLVTEDRTLRIPVADPLTVYEARRGDGYKTIQSGDIDLSSMGMHGKVTITGSVEKMEVEGPGISLGTGYYVITDSSSPVSHRARVIVEEHRAFSMQWEHGGRHHSITLDIPYSDVAEHSISDPLGNLRFLYGDRSQVERFFTSDDPIITELAVILEDLSGGMSGDDLAAFVLSFVQNIPYVSDPESTGQRECWKYPVETLWDGGGDCEDSSILYAVLMKALGQRSAIMIFDGHAMAGVALDSPRGQTMWIDGWLYSFCETTATGFDPGDTSDRRLYNPSTVLFAYGTS